LTRAPASSLWTMATTSFTRGVSTARATGVNVSAGHGFDVGGAKAGCYDAGPATERVQE
jgi:pyridoxine 5'-phosphate synthase PdxJ